MPEPDSAFSVRRESNVAVKLVWPSTSAGIPARPRVWSSTIRPGAERTTAPTMVEGRSARGTSPSGPAEVTWRSIGVAKRGAPAAAQMRLMTSTTGWGSGLTRWNASPSRPGRCARWSIAEAT